MIFECTEVHRPVWTTLNLSCTGAPWAGCTASGGVLLEHLCLSELFPSAERAGVTIAFDYMQWLNARGISPATEGARGTALHVYSF